MPSTSDPLTTRLRDAARSAHAVVRLHRTGVIDLTRLDLTLRAARNNNVYGPPASMIMAVARRAPDAPALADERGVLTYRELDEQSNALANALLAMGLTPGSVAGVLARDHRGLILAISAAGRAGLRLALMNTGFAKPQFAEVAARERVRAMLHDSEFNDLLDALPSSLPRILTWVDEGHSVPPGAQVLDDLIATGSRAVPPPPQRPGGFTILTSGTTGLPKGAPRTKVTPLASVQLVDRIPFPRRGTILIASPVFHSTGFSNWVVGTALGNKIVLARRFDPENTLRMLAAHRADMLVAVPTMLQRILQLGPEVIRGYDLSALKTIAVSGSALSPELATRTQDIFGAVLHNIYGSTEVGIAAVAQPKDLRLAPGTVGRPPLTSEVAIFDGQDRRITEAHLPGRVFVRSAIPFEGYTDGRHKQVIDGYMTTGDIGHLDAHGLLHIDGRDDDMIVSGGENVYPLEIENLLAERADVQEVAVIGVEDPEFGTRLRAVVVPSPGATVSAEEIKAYVRANLARYKVPRDVVLVDQLPRNATGKVLRRALRDL
ncbi:acyl-CoA synthetase [Streptacidiphilus cavernicola]|uniref:Acyl-CoA synthetase n=1 Tax=Streptacidiphilus cavernicola TaxID=3342716 RepID=A0ABV6W553_9ACTN